MNNSVSTMSGKTKLKIVLLGNQAVGKSSIIQKYVKDIFDQSSNPTVGIDFLVKNVTHKAKTYRLQLWDTAGQQRFRSLIPNYLKDAKCALIVIDVTNRASLSSVESWLSLYNQNKTGEGIAFLIGNKIDLDYRDVTKQQGKKKAEQLGIPYFELSAKTGENVQSLFYKVIEAAQQPNMGSANFDQGQKKQKESNQIKQSAQQEQDDGKNKKSTNNGGAKTNNSVTNAPAKQNVNTSEKITHENTNIVLKNQKLASNAEEKKKKSGCC